MRLIAPDDMPERFQDLAYLGTGDSLIVDPRGEVVARAPRGEESILNFEGDTAVIRSAKAAMDVAGHYSRPDVFDLRVNGIPTAQLSTVTDDDGCRIETA